MHDSFEMKPAQKTFSELGAFLQDPLNEHLQKAIDDGAIPIGYTCSYVPEVMLSVGKLMPVRVRAPGVSGTEIADAYLFTTSCSYVRSLLEFAVDGRYDFLRGWVFASSCTHLARLYDNIDYLTKPDFGHMLDVPNILKPSSLVWYREELDNLRKALASHFGIVMDDAALSAAIIDYNAQVKLLKAVGDLRKQEFPPFSGGDFHRLMLAWTSLPSSLTCELAQKMLDKAKEGATVSKYRARLLVMGSEVDEPGYLDLIESQGGLVVADRFCNGSLPALTTIDENIDPLTAITKHTFARTECPRMMGEWEQRIERIKQLITEYRVDGVVLQVIKFCDKWGVEAAVMVKALRKAGIPVLRLEREYRLSDVGQAKTRIQAFMESMGK